MSVSSTSSATLSSSSLPGALVWTDFPLEQERSRQEFSWLYSYSADLLVASAGCETLYVGWDVEEEIPVSVSLWSHVSYHITAQSVVARDATNDAMQQLLSEPAATQTFDTIYSYRVSTGSVMQRTVLLVKDGMMDELLEFYRTTVIPVVRKASGEELLAWYIGANRTTNRVLSVSLWQSHSSLVSSMVDNKDVMTILQQLAHFTTAKPSRSVVRVTYDSSMPVKLYWHPMSPPSRIVHYFALASGINIKKLFINLQEGEQRQQSYLRVNPHGKVPAIDDEGYLVNESFAIIRYLANKYNSCLYPIGVDPVAQVKIDMAVEMLKHTLIDLGSKIIYNRALASKATANLAEAASAEQELNQALTVFDGSFFKDSRRYVVGKSLTLADIVLSTWSAQLVAMCSYDLSAFPNLRVWLDFHHGSALFKRTHKPFFAALKKFTTAPTPSTSSSPTK